MPIQTENLNKKLYELLKVQGYNPVPKDSEGQTTPVPDEAEVFQFTFSMDGEDYGKVWITIDSSQNLIVYFDDKVTNSDDDGGGRNWTRFLQQLKNWAQRRQLSFELKNQNHLASDMAQRSHMKKKEQIAENKKLNELSPKTLASYGTKAEKSVDNLRDKSGKHQEKAFDMYNKGGASADKSWDHQEKAEKLAGKADKRDSNIDKAAGKLKKYMSKGQLEEGYYPMGKSASYNDNIPTVKIVLQHTRQIQEGEQRYRNIAKIFLENQQGERILCPSTKPGIAQIYARHLAEGGLPHDERWNHIGSLVEEYSKMAGFVRATRSGQFNESAQQLVNEGINHYNSLRETLSKMRGHRGYQAYFESYTPNLMETEGDESINELFVQETLDPRIESVMPILAKLHKKVNEMSEVSELAEWADNIIETENRAALNPIGIPESLEEEVGDVRDEEDFKERIKNIKKMQLTQRADPTRRLAKLKQELIKKAKEKGIDTSSEELEEDLGPEQKAVGQLGPTEKVGSKGAVGKLVGANESVELEEGHMSNVDVIMQELGSGERDIYDTMNHPKTPDEQYAAGILQDMYDSVASDSGLHPDDDFEQIIDIMGDRIADEYPSEEVDEAAPGYDKHSLIGKIRRGKEADEKGWGTLGTGFMKARDGDEEGVKKAVRDGNRYYNLVRGKNKTPGGFPKSTMKEQDVEEAAKWRSTSVAQKVTDPEGQDSVSYDYHYDNPRSTGMMRASSDKATPYGSLNARPSAKVATQGDRKGKITKQHAERLKARIKAAKHEVDEGKFTVNAKTGAKLDPKTGAELPPKEKPITKKQMFAPKPKAPAAPKLTLNDVWRKVEDVVGQIYPDGDPIDWLAPWFRKQGIEDHKIGDILERAAKKNGYKDIYDYWNSFGEDVGYVNEGKKDAHEQNMDAAQKEMDRREAEGEDMTGAKIDPKTYKITKPKQDVKEGQEDLDAILRIIRK